MDISKTKMADVGTMMGGSPSSDAGPELAAGKVIGDRYEIIGVIGRGGMGVVYEASDNLGQTQVALKFLRPELVSNDTAIQRFLNEARIVRDLSHPNIVRVYDVSRYENTYFLSMERLEGRSLRQLLEELKSRSEPMSVRQALSIAKDVTQALAYAHRTTIHRDLKPENVWVLPDGRAKLMDFGIARLQSQTQGLTKVASALGTAYYMAPEQLVGSGAVDARADQYALGVMLYEMLTGTLPLGRSEAASQVRAGLTKKFDEVLDRLLGSKPEKRYGSDEEVLKALDALPALEPVRGKAKPLRESASNDAGASVTSKRGAIAALIILLLVAGGWWGYSQWQQSTAAEAARVLAARESSEKALRLRMEADRVGKPFRDCSSDCPEMVVVPRGTFNVLTGGFMMGSDETEVGRDDDEGPKHKVVLDYFLALSTHEVKRGEFRVFVKETNHKMGECQYWDGQTYQTEKGVYWHNRTEQKTDSYPVVCVNWEDASAYAKWLSKKTGKQYRLPSEAEWEYAARGGTATARYWGDSEKDQCRHANGADATMKASGYDVKKGVSCKDGYAETAPVGSFSANPYGLYDVLGNAWEWVEDCYQDSYNGAPEDGSAWTSGGCYERVLRGGGWDSGPGNLRSANRFWVAPALRDFYNGFRLARTE